MTRSRLVTAFVVPFVAGCSSSPRTGGPTIEASGPERDAGGGAQLAAIETTHDVSAADIQKLMSGEGGVDLEPVYRDGQQVAMRVVGVKPGTTAARLGAVNGDVLETINDLPLTSIPGAYDVAAKVATAPTIVVRGHRGSIPFVTTLRF